MKSPNTLSSDESVSEQKTELLNALKNGDLDQITTATDELDWEHFLIIMANYPDINHSPIAVAMNRHDLDASKVLDNKAKGCFAGIKKSLPSRYTEVCRNAFIALIDQAESDYEKEKSWYQTEADSIAQKERAIQLLYQTRELVRNVERDDKDSEEHIANFYENSKQLIRSETLKKCFWSLLIILTATLVLGIGSMFIAAAIKGGALAQIGTTFSTSSLSALTFADIKAELIAGLSIGVASGIIAGVACVFGLFSTNHKINQVERQIHKPEQAIPKGLSDFD